MSALMSIADARRLLFERFQPLPLEKVPIEEADGRVLGEDVTAVMDLPPFANSSVDGFAVRAREVASAAPAAPVRLPVAGDIPAGAAQSVFLLEGHAARIMTGAPLPPGADSVVPMELTDLDRASIGAPLPAHVTIREAPAEGANIRPAGLDIRAGMLALARGTPLRPQEVALLAALGRGQVLAYRRPRVAILSTGDELVSPGSSLRHGQIYESNAIMLAAMVRRAGGVAIDLGIARDNLKEILTRLDWAVREEANLILTSAGVSVGAFDLVRSAIEQHGSIEFWRVDLRPGKPLAFGLYRGLPVLGLPGNPVSSFVTFELFARDAMRALEGRTPRERPRLRVTVEEDLTSDGRESYLRARLRREGRELYARLVGEQASSVLSTLAAANGLLIIPSGVREVHAGTQLDAWSLDE
jgi:molybdopterin molybdotransferase